MSAFEATSGGEHAGPSLGLYALGSLEGADLEAVERHLLTCTDCRAECDQLMAVTGLLDLLTPDDVDTAPPAG